MWQPALVGIQVLILLEHYKPGKAALLMHHISAPARLKAIDIRISPMHIHRPSISISSVAGCMQEP